MQTRSRTVALLLFDEVELLDVAGPLSVLSNAGRHWNWRPFKVLTLAETPGPIATRSQLTLHAEHGLDACEAPELVIVPGGYGARRALENPLLEAWLGRAARSATTLAAVGNGLLLLGKAGLLAGETVPAREALAAELLELEPTITIQAPVHGSSDLVLESGRLLAASGSGASIELGLRIVSRVLGPKLANGTAQGLGIPWLAPEPTVSLLEPDGS